MLKICYIINKLVLVSIPVFGENICGCKTMRKCYLDMLNTLRDKDEEICIENVLISTNTLMVFLDALKMFCPEIVKVRAKYYTYEQRPLYEVVLSHANNESKVSDKSKPVIIVEAGQFAGTEPVRMMLVFIQELTACEEYAEMTKKIQWVILPCVNPDGMVYGRHNRVQWRKNMRPSEDNLAFGVDLSRNFKSDLECHYAPNTFSNHYAGSKAFSENESQFVRDMLLKYSNQTRAYVSMRRNGHSVLYPYASTNKMLYNQNEIMKLASGITNKVNQQTGLVHVFMNDSIYAMNGHFRCGHSVDYAYDLGIRYAFEMRVFLESESELMTLFQGLPKNYIATLLRSYLSGIKRLYELVILEL